jgi:hypothetical protein
MDAFLDSWDGNKVHIKQMIRDVHAHLQQKHFRYEDLVETLKARGFRVDRETGMVVRTV